MTRTRRLLLLTTLLAAIPATAHAAPGGLETQTFKVSVKGFQKTEWVQGYEPQSRCDQGASGWGGEDATFWTHAPYRMKVQRAGDFVIFNKNISLQTKVDRNSRLDFTPLPIDCHGTGGGGIAERDCGKINGAFPILFGWETARGGGINIDNRKLDDFYNNCPLLGYGMPQLLDFDAKSNRIAARIPAADLFDESIGKHIVIARGKRRVDSLEGSYTTRLRYEITLKRVK